MSHPDSVAVVHERDDPPVAVVELRGEHDNYTATRITSELTRLQDEGLPIVVDLRPASFVDSSTLSVLLAARREAETFGLALVLVIDSSAAAQVQRIFSLTGLAGVFDVYDDRDAAVAAARAGAVRAATDAAAERAG